MPDDAPVQAAASPPLFTSNVPIPPKIQLKGNLASNWKQWKQIWNAYELVTKLKDQSDEYRVATFITCIGQDALAIHNGLPFTSEDEKKNMDKIIELWDSYCLGRTNITYERYMFNARDQKENESIEAYASALRSLANTCNFGPLKEELIRDRIVCGLSDNEIRKKLLQIPELTLDKCMNICRSAETTTSQLKAMSNNNAHSPQEVNYVKSTTARQTTTARHAAQDLINDCRFCGQTHEKKREKCPAQGKICKKCKKENHFAIKCQAKYPKEQRKPPKQKFKKRPVNTVTDEYSSDEESDASVLTVSLEEVNVLGDKRKGKKIFATMMLQGGQRIKMLVDSGASCNVIPMKVLPKGTLIKRTDKTLSMYSKSTMNAVGKTTIKITNPKNAESYNVDFIVVQGEYTPLLGLQTAITMKLLKVRTENILQVADQVPVETTPLTKESVLEEYADVFGDDLGRMEGKVHLETDPSVVPTVNPPRRVPLAIKDKLKTEIDRLTKREVISPVEEPTDWVSSMISVLKPNGTMRLCIDPKNLNCALKRSHYPLPTIEELLPELSKAKVFSKADLKEGFLQVELDEESSILTTFQTPWGRYRWHRMPFGIAPAPEIFQMKLDQNLEGLSGVFKIADDILITGQGDNDQLADQDHDRNLENLLRRCRKKNIKLNRDKFDFKKDEVSFIGHRLTKEGLKPDPNKVTAILNMKKPDDVPALQRLLGMVKYLSKFLSDLSQMSEPLRRLTHKDVPWEWKDEQERAFSKIKEAVSSAPVLKYFDSSKLTEGSGDASSKGLGFVLTQKDHPITYASRALTPAEQNYSQIEKELLAQVFGLEHNHQYMYGRKVILYTDHKPLVSITKKPLATAPKRLQRLLLRLQHYDVEIKYTPGRQMYLADTLSRAYLDTTGDESSRSEVEKEVESIHAVDYLAISEPQLQEIKTETEKDSTLRSLKDVILRGWPDARNAVPANVQPYFNFRDELAVQDGIIFKGTRCIVPTALRPKIKERLHRSHIGVQGCLRRAREVVYWPSMNQEITDYIEQCEVCNTFAAQQQKEPLIVHDVPQRPWQKIGCDIFTVNQKDYLCTVDYYSGYFEVDKLDRKTAKPIITRLKRHFSTHGIPSEFYSDNGPPFDSQEFREFSREYEFTIITSSPNYPQSNGRVENAVKTAKRLMKKAKEAGTDFYLALLDWRNTPTEGVDSSPVQRLFGRRTRTLIPTASALLTPKVPQDIRTKLLYRKAVQTKYYDRNAKELPPLKQGDQVRISPKPNDRTGKWTKAEVQEQVDIRSYNVRTEDGRVYRRNRRHLRKSQPDVPPPQTTTEVPTEYQTPVQPYQAPPSQRGKTVPPETKAPVKPPPSPTSSKTVPPKIQENPVRTTRSGREVKPPSYLKDYVKK